MREPFPASAPFGGAVSRAAVCFDFSDPRGGVFAAPFFVDPRFAMSRIMRSRARFEQRKQKQTDRREADPFACYQTGVVNANN
jgi:hypothetical protein